MFSLEDAAWNYRTPTVGVPYLTQLAKWIKLQGEINK